MCLANCRARSWEPKKYPTQAEQDAKLPLLLDWVRGYYSRTGDLSLSAHRRLFECPLRRTSTWLLVVGCFTSSGSAAILNVTNTNDNGAGSLRQAIQDAVSGDTINFAVTGTITLTNGELLITNNMAVVGPGATNLAVSGPWTASSPQTAPASGLVEFWDLFPPPGQGFYRTVQP